MAKEIKYPDIPMKDSAIDTIKVKTGTDISYKSTPNKYKETARSLTTTDSGDGSSTSNFTKQTVKTTDSGSKQKFKDYFLSKETNGDAKLQITKESSSGSAKQKIVSGNKAENKFSRVLNRN